MEFLNRCKCGRTTNFGPLCVQCSGEKDKNNDIDLEDLKQYEDCEDFLEDEED
jgi:hypothetical protein